MNAGWLSRTAVIALISTGCGGSTQIPAPATVTAGGGNAHGHTHNAADHNHPRGKMLMASDGSTSALLTAHLSPEGNELDIFFEREGAPYALDAKAVDVQIESATGPRTIRFDCAPQDERPKNEKTDTCSHYVAKVPGMSRTEPIKVTTSVGAASGAFVWRDFVPVTYAHHDG